MKKLLVGVLAAVSAAVLLITCASSGASGGSASGSQGSHLAFTVIRSMPPLGRHIAWSPDGSKIAIGVPTRFLDQNRIIILDMASASVVNAWSASFLSDAEKRFHPGEGQGRMAAIAYSSDGNNIAIGLNRANSDTGTVLAPGAIRTFDAASGKPVALINDMPGIGSTLLGYSPDSQNMLALFGTVFNEYLSHLWIMNTNGSVAQTLWDAATMAKKLSNPGSGLSSKSFDDPEFRHAVYSPDGKTVAGAGFESIRIWDSANGRTLRNLPCKNGSALTYSNDGTLLVLGTMEGTVTLFNMQTNSEARTFEGLKTFIWTVTISPDKKYVMALDENGLLKVWELESGKEIQSFQIGPISNDTRLFARRGAVRDVAFSPDATRIALRNSENYIQVWDIASGQCVSFAFYEEDKWAVISEKGNAWNTAGQNEGISFIASVDGKGNQTMITQASNNVETLTKILTGKTGAVLGTAAATENNAVDAPALANGTYSVNIETRRYGGPNYNFFKYYLHRIEINGNQFNVFVSTEAGVTNNAITSRFKEIKLTNKDTGDVYVPVRAREQSGTLVLNFTGVKGRHFSLTVPTLADPCEFKDFVLSRPD